MNVLIEDRNVHVGEVPAALSQTNNHVEGATRSAGGSLFARAVPWRHLNNVTRAASTAPATFCQDVVCQPASHLHRRCLSDLHARTLYLLGASSEHQI